MSEKNASRRPPHVVFYTRPGCHLCEEAEREIAAARCHGLYTFEKVNIDADPDLVRRHGWEIPVVVIDGTVAFKHRLTAEDFRRAVTAEAEGEKGR
ncbi:MAG TPA: glutaredoxin family protein [Pyrinomonadaceae bacterium]